MSIADGGSEFKKPGRFPKNDAVGPRPSPAARVGDRGIGRGGRPQAASTALPETQQWGKPPGRRRVAAAGTLVAGRGGTPGAHQAGCR